MRTVIVLGLAVGVVLAGCDTAGQDTAAPVVPAATTAAPTTTAARPKPTPAPVTIDAPCPYAATAAVMDIIGQHLDRTTVTTTAPHPGCAFYRPDAEKAAEVAVSVLPSAAAAQAEAIRLGGRSANPVDGVADGGTVAITDAGAVLAVSKGAALVVVRINQRMSLEAIELARLVVAKV